MNAMRFVFKALVLAAGVLLLPSGSAHAQMWCLRDFGSDKPVCVFGTARDCASAAVIRGGICEREPLVSRIRRSPHFAAPSERTSDTKGH